MSMPTFERPKHELRFASRFDAARALTFPCDDAGRVDIDALDVDTLNNYLYARALVGLEFRSPTVCEHPADRLACARSTTAAATPPPR